jgi:hypothetical protein
MKKIIKHLSRPHKVKIHHNRWLIWCVALSFILLMGLFSYIEISNYSFMRNSTEGYYYLKKQGQSFKDSYNGFSVKHPRSWGIEAESRNSIAFIDPTNYGESITVSVYSVSDEASIIKSMGLKDGREIVLGSASGKLYLRNSNNIPEKAVLIKSDKRLFVIRGNSKYFEGFLRTFQILPPTTSN